MHNLIKNKKGVGLAFGIIIGIVILLLSVVVIVVVIKDSASKADEKAQVELCRVSNEIKLGIDRKTGTATDILLGPAPRICSTISKIKKKSQVPIKMYPQDKGGAEAEIREMIKNCWYMWLEGSESNMFGKTFGSECFVCYKFNIKDEVDEDVEFGSLAESMTEPFFVEDASDKCAPVGGFHEDSCESRKIRTDKTDEWKEIPSEKAASENQKCCISKNAANECENKGGMCSEEGPSGEYNRIYYKWYCPKAKQRCYVKEEHMFSYIKYITEYGRMGGDVYFIPPTMPEEYDTLNEVKQAPEGITLGTITYPTGQMYAISFISPSEKFCQEGETRSCALTIGGFALAAVAVVGIGVAAGIILAPVVVSAAGAAGTAVVSTVGTAKVVVGASAAAATVGVTGYAAYETGILGRFLNEATNWILGPFRENVPSFMIVSTVEVAQQMGCSITGG